MDKAIITALNLKGGAGKTTLSVNLAAVLAEQRKKVVLIDLDPQQSATRWAKQGGEDFPVDVRPLSMEKGARQFREKIDAIKADVIVIDCPPAIADEAMVATLLSNLVLIPTTPSPFDFWATEEAVKMVREARKERNGTLPGAALVPSRLVSNTVLAREIAETLTQLGEAVAPGITQRVAMVESAIAGTTINKFAPGSAAHQEFKALASFALKQLRKTA